MDDLEYMDRRFKYPRVTDQDIYYLGTTQLTLKNLLMDYEYHSSDEIYDLLKDFVFDPLKEIRYLRQRGYTVIKKRVDKVWWYKLLSPLEEHLRKTNVRSDN